MRGMKKENGKEEIGGGGNVVVEGSGVGVRGC